MFVISLLLHVFDAVRADTIQVTMLTFSTTMPGIEFKCATKLTITHATRSFTAAADAGCLTLTANGPGMLNVNVPVYKVTTSGAFLFAQRLHSWLLFWGVRSRRGARRSCLRSNAARHS